MSAALDAYKKGQRELWSAGDYATIARRFEGAAEQLVSACAIGPGQRVLDIAAGNGNAALAAAAAGASVTACDLTPSLVAAGRARTQHAGVEVQWSEADAEQLPFEDGSFDAAISVFGLIFAPQPEVALAEAVRVTAAGGRVGIVGWTPDSASDRFSAIRARHMGAPPQAMASPYAWADEAIARERFAQHGVDDVHVELGSVTWSWPSAAAAREELEERNPAVVAAGAELSPERFIALVDDLEDLIRSLNTARDGDVAYDAEYTCIVGRKPD
jgi:SAM-dependent methyltransferase